LQAIAQERVQGTIRALAPVSTTDQERNESRRGLI
jgi:hypothetical protein